MSVDVAYRRATSADALCLSVLASQVFLDTYATSGINVGLAGEVTTVLSRRAFLDRLEAGNGELFVAEIAGNMIGFVDLDYNSPCPDPEFGGLEVLRLYVQRPFHRHRVGRSLLSIAGERARTAGRDSLWLTVWVGNAQARAFYAALGWKDVGFTHHVIDRQTYENRVLVRASSAIS